MTSSRLRAAALCLLLAGSAMTVPVAALAQSAFTSLDRASAGTIRFSATERGKPILAGGEVAVSGDKFHPGQTVTLLYGSTPLQNGTLTANGEGKVEGKIVVPANAVAGTHPIVVVAQGPYSANVADLKVSPTIPLSGQQNYKVTEAATARGVYQSAYSAKNNSLFTASAIGRPPVSQSELVKLDANTLKVVARVTPQQAPDRPGRGTPRGAPGGQPAANAPSVFAVYGVAVDDAKGTVWATNTRQNTVAVYNQSDLSLVKQFAPETVAHPRDVAVDSALGKAYVSAVGKSDIYVIDTAALGAPRAIPVRSLGRGKEFSGTSLSFDPVNHRLYAVSLSTSEVAVINTQTDTVEKVFAVPGGRGTIGVSHDPQTGRIYVVGQGGDNLTVLDGTSGAVIADTMVGAGALNVVFDPVKRRAYIANRGASSIAVTDADGKLVANLGPAPTANHVALGKNGTIYAAVKSAGASGEESDTIMAIQAR